MSARGFGSVGWVAGVAATALGCYMVSLQVASTRASLEDVETEIVIAQRDIRVLQTEIGTRGRLAQLERWNVKVLALSAPQANQFLEGGFQLASMIAPKKTVDPAAPVVLASAPATEDKPVLEQDVGNDGPLGTGADAKSLMHVASLKRDLPEPQARPPVKVADEQKPRASAKPKAEAKTAAAAKAAPGTKAADKKAVDKPGSPKLAAADTLARAAKPRVSQVEVDPLAPKPTKSKEAKPKQ